jgi:hypothetical protein
MIEIRNSNNEVIDIETAKLLSVNINQPESNPGILNIYNSGPEVVNNVGLYLMPTSMLGEIDHFSNKTPDEFVQELLSLGSQDEPFGLKVYFFNEEFFFSESNGANKQNKIILKEELNPNEFIQIQLKYFRSPNSEAEISYVGVQAE